MKGLIQVPSCFFCPRRPEKHRRRESAGYVLKFFKLARIWLPHSFIGISMFMAIKSSKVFHNAQSAQGKMLIVTKNEEQESNITANLFI
jgi:hypothetical protein